MPHCDTSEYKNAWHYHVGYLCLRKTCDGNDRTSCLWLVCLLLPSSLILADTQATSHTVSGLNTKFLYCGFQENASERSLLVYQRYLELRLKIIVNRFE